MKRTILLTALVSAISANTFAATPVEEFIAFEEQVAQEATAWHDFFQKAHADKMKIVRDTKTKTFELRKDLDNDLKNAKNETDINAAYTKALKVAKDLYAQENEAWENWFTNLQKQAENLHQKYDKQQSVLKEPSTKAPTATHKAATAEHRTN